MAEITHSSKGSDTSDIDSYLNNEDTRIDIRLRFENLLDDSTTDDEESTTPEIDNQHSKKNTLTQATINQRSSQRPRSEDESDEVILSLIWSRGHLGAAYYNIPTSELFVMDDMMDSDHNIMRTLYRQTDPRYVVTTTAMADSFLNEIKKLVLSDAMNEKEGTTAASSSSNISAVGASLDILPKKDNTADNCYHRVLCLKLNCEPEDASNAERKTFLNSLLNFESTLMIHALGLLLKYIDVNWNKLTLNPNGHAEFIHISYVMLEDSVMIDEDTYKGLDIIKSRYHPSLFKFGSLENKNQGLSLFTLLNRCQSRPGVSYLWKLLRHPTRDTNVLSKRFEAIKFFLNPDNQNIVETLKSSLTQVCRLPSNILNRYSAPRAKVSDWSRLQKTLCQIMCIGDICSEHRNSISIFAKLANSITPDMHCVRYFIEYIIDFDLSKSQGKLVMKDGVDPQLDELNNLRLKLPQLLSEAAEKDMKKYPSIMEKCRMIYLPDIRYVLAITEGTSSGDETAIPGLEFKFTINGVRHYKSDGARELDNTIGDILFKITTRQSHILLRLVRFLSKHVGSILKSLEICAELDTLLAFSMVARDHNYVMPQMVLTKTIDIKRGRHPLKELIVNFVPNDTHSSNESSLIKILTGPNACGKSIYLKQLALIVFMAHIGSFVPAESATIGIISHIFTQLHSTDSLAQNASSFLLSLRQINVALYGSTPSSLVIFDEFGTGTTEIDGAALLTAVLKSFYDRGIQCPHIFAATHIHRVIELLPQSRMIEAQTFEFLSNESNDLVFLYRLISGKTSCSFAHSVAKNAGLAEDVVHRALEVFEAKKRGILPPPLPQFDEQEKTMIHIMELVSDPSGKIDLEELKLWVRQATGKPQHK
ncbi:mutS protein homolog 5-like [Venturia canescens]|uniref:mutS protein homolog 5-like n=1 Tax=Venturia canescens TaxID=32260 RepID=UPI001C9D2C75|nr:mutS protein homolog 5-like [Venturia canescens]